MKPPTPIHFKEAWIIFFVMGVIMLNYPFIHIFNKEGTILGIPLIILYFMVGWPISIFVVYLFSRVIEKDHGDIDKREDVE